MKRVWNKFLVGFFNGVVILLPAVVTIALIRFLVIKVNTIVLNPIMRMLAALTGTGHNVYLAKTLIFTAVIAAITMIGWGARIIFLNRLFSLGERILIRVPIMGRLYYSAKQIFSAFLGQGKTIFKRVVLVEYPRKGMYAIGFITGDTGGEIRERVDTVSMNVFVPTTPNPTSGVFLVVPVESVHFLSMSVEDGMKMVVSGGSVTPARKGGKK
jgi:uncharacterized membrane protein